MKSATSLQVLAAARWCKDWHTLYKDLNLSWGVMKKTAFDNGIYSLPYPPLSKKEKEYAQR